MPARDSIYEWLAIHDEFSDQYSRACAARTEVHGDEVVEIADDATNDYMTIRNERGELERVPDPEVIQRSKLRVETRLKLMALMQPKKYGRAMTLKGDPDAPLIPPAIVVPKKDLLGASATERPRNPVVAKPAPS